MDRKNTMWAWKILCGHGKHYVDTEKHYMEMKNTMWTQKSLHGHGIFVRAVH